MMKDRFLQAEHALEKTVSQDPWRLRFHLMPPAGWLNDPNGLCEKDGIYHIYYQYSPEDPSGGAKGWGHYSTRDFCHYTQEAPALFPDSPIDRDGAYSGSAFVDGDTIHFFYTGNIKEEGDHDYIHSGRGHYTNHFTSRDGIHFSPKECLLKNEDYPADLTCHVRDPKIYKEGDTLYLILGARTSQDTGCALVFTSRDLLHWTYLNRIETPRPFGYMWECPDLFELDGQKILLCCPQGVKQDGIRYENVYQNGYFLADGSMESGLQLSGFQELDHGFDFYAPQTFEDEQGRRILIGWMGIPDADYTNPTVERGWQHALTLPRVLSLKDGRLLQYPIEEIESLRMDEKPVFLKPGQTEILPDRVFELHLETGNQPFVLKLRDSVVLRYEAGILSLEFEKNGYGRSVRHLKTENLTCLDLFSDTSSLEIFVNKGEGCFTTRIYDEPGPCRLECSRDMSGTFWQLKSFEIEKAEA